MFFNQVNYLNITIWVIGGILVLVLFGLIIWRFIKRDEISRERIDKSVGKSSKSLAKLIISMESIYGWSVAYNILIKNRFAKLDYSLIPGIIFCDGAGFLIGNFLDATKKDVVITTDHKFVFAKTNKPVPGIKYEWYTEILRYLRSASDIEFKLLIPVKGLNYKNKSDLILVDDMLMDEKIALLAKSVSTEDKADTSTMVSLFKKLDSANMIKATHRLSGRKAKAL